MSDIRTLDPEVEAKMEEISTKFERYISNQKSQIIKSKEDFKNKLQHLRNEYKEYGKELQSLAEREVELNKELAKEVQDKNSSSSRLNELKLKEETLIEDRKNLEKQVLDLSNQVNERRQELNKLKISKEKQAERDIPQVLIYEQVLSLKIEGGKQGYLTFKFHNIDPKNTEREFQLNLKVDGSKYEDLSTIPEISQDDVNELLIKFNETRNLNSFLKNARQAFKKMV
ncbi:putative kinetochore protein spc25 [Wickerhamomyces ciferrii]|uniref:Kinetochore protein SPC25 n=1 Tax=Wickerhamomyces ciferrii (strain ATCC 14091 / BCRC 22168 / CBS 111 / JCM 3599 / NBRC 0793 / NRRL Y-1031 F-60-10) TaxID=1206466 RepID=K0KKU0_WICCF|nr:putative kinetochore protein spc25 [Wickerhamomyces ciferrii]CCH45815.1 putative kinetochore protein spc25 [Wickerhamomyces ciferrii]